MIQASTSIFMPLQPTCSSTESFEPILRGPSGHNVKRMKIALQKNPASLVPMCWQRRSGSCGAVKACLSRLFSLETFRPGSCNSGHQVHCTGVARSFRFGDGVSGRMALVMLPSAEKRGRRLLFKSATRLRRRRHN